MKCRFCAFVADEPQAVIAHLERHVLSWQSADDEVEAVRSRTRQTLDRLADALEAAAGEVRRA